MKNIISVQHSVYKYTCMVNGLGDVYRSKTGQKFSDEFLMIISGMAHFAYIKNRKVEPPFMVFWGQSVKNQYKNLEAVLGLKIKITEGKGFKFALELVKEEVNKRNPVIIGPLDMFYLEYHTFFQRIHELPHFVLVVGYDDALGQIFLYDCDLPDLQKLSYENLQKAWQTSEPGYIKKNTVISFSVPSEPLSFSDTVKKGLIFKAISMLNPPIKNIGISGIRKLSTEFSTWEAVLNVEEYKKALEHMAKYANTPPTLSIDYNDFTAQRGNLSKLLKDLAATSGERRLLNVSDSFSNSGKLIREVSLIILEWLNGQSDRRKFIPQLLAKVADIEEEAYGAIKGIYRE